VITTIFFDFGGVIIKPPHKLWVDLWKNLMDINAQPEVLEMLENPNGSQLIEDICLGKIPEDYMWVMMAEKWHVNPATIAFFRRWLFSKNQLNKKIVNLMEELHGHYQTAILSNAGNKTRRLLEDIYHLDHFVDEIIISAEEGAIKPDRRIFEIAMERLNTKPASSLLLDDSLTNVFAAREFGMAAVQFINNHQAIQLVRDILDERD
jgi:HAD superfamily hydrolase (TIGR01509 family)